MAETFEPASAIQDFLVFGEYGDVNPSITDSATYTFLNPETMQEMFEHGVEGCYLYSRHWNPTNKYLSEALSAMEHTESAQVTASGMSAIACTLLQLCQTGDEIISSWTIYGGSYALFKNFLPRLGIRTLFGNFRDLDAIKKLITKKTKIIYTESISNPLLEVADINNLAKLAHEHGLTLVVDNTFSPMILSPARLGADVVVHSMTKFINGTSDCVAGCICASKQLIDAVIDVNSGATMLLGPVLDSFRAASILKNLHSLHVRMQQHSHNALKVATFMHERGLKVYYPGLKTHEDHLLMKSMMHPMLGFGGMITLDVGSVLCANKLMALMQQHKVGYLAVSLGYFKTLFSAPSHSTSSEIPVEIQQSIGLRPGMIRLSIGLDQDIGRTIARLTSCLNACGF